MGWLTSTSALRRQRGEISQISELWDQLREPASRNKAKSDQGRLPRSSLILHMCIHGHGQAHTHKYNVGTQICTQHTCKHAAMQAHTPQIQKEEKKKKISFAKKSLKNFSTSEFSGEFKFKSQRMAGIARTKHGIHACSSSTWKIGTRGYWIPSGGHSWLCHEAISSTLPSKPTNQKWKIGKKSQYWHKQGCEATRALVCCVRGHSMVQAFPEGFIRVSAGWPHSQLITQSSTGKHLPKGDETTQAEKDSYKCICGDFTYKVPNWKQSDI